MAQDTTVPKLNFEYWLEKATEWGQATTLESQKDVCLHLPQLQEFLHQLYETLKDVGSVAAIQQFPLIGQLLGRLCWNPFVIGYDESQKALMWCLCCLYSSEPQNPVELKANSWIRSLLCHLLSSSKWESNEAETSPFVSTLGYTSADYYCHLVKNMVFSLVAELRENQFNGLNTQRSVSASRVNAVSVLCVPLITLPDLSPLLETLLLYHGGSPEEILCPEFLEAVNEAFLNFSGKTVIFSQTRKKISLPESAVFSLWLRHLPSLEKAALHLLDRLVSIQLNSLEEVACVIKGSLLPQAAIHPAIFRVVNELFKNALLETDGTSEVMTIIQVFTQLFLEAHQNQNKQHAFPLKAYFPCHHQPLLRALLTHPCDLPATSRSQHLKNISDMLKALVEDTNISSLTDLFEIWFLVACFGEWVDIAAEQLLKDAAQPDALLWLLSFYYCPRNEDQQRTRAMCDRFQHSCIVASSEKKPQEITAAEAEKSSETLKEQHLEIGTGAPGVRELSEQSRLLSLCSLAHGVHRGVEVQAVCSHLMMLFSCTDLSVRDLEAAVHRITGTEQCCNQHLLTHLLTSFLLFSSGGHTVAQECIHHITETADSSKQVYSLLIRTAHRLQHNGEENQRTVKLLKELLQKLTWKV